MQNEIVLVGGLGKKVNDIGNMEKKIQGAWQDGPRF
jgi:hypothetical protein